MAHIEQVARYSKLLRHAIRAAGFTVAGVERELGIGEKGLQRILNGRVDLKMRHVFEVLRVIAVPEDEFFAAAIRPLRQRRSRAELFAAFRRIGYRGEELFPFDEPGPSPEDFDQIVDDALDRALERRVRQGKPLLDLPPPTDAEEPPGID